MMLRAILTAALGLALYKEDAPGPEKTAQLTAISAAVAEFTRTPDEAAFLLAWGQAETNFSLRVHSGQCRPWECDRGRARGPWQAHRNGMSEERWSRMIGVENTRVQAECAAKHARWALFRCKGDARCAFRLLGGLAPTTPLRGEEKRLEAFRKIRGVL